MRPLALFAGSVGAYGQTAGRAGRAPLSVPRPLPCRRPRQGVRAGSTECWRVLTVTRRGAPDVFSTASGSPWNHRNASRAFDLALSRAKLGEPKVSTHDLRHVQVEGST